MKNLTTDFEERILAESENYYILRNYEEAELYDRNTPQWIETGREGNIVWCDHIDEVTNDNVLVSLDGGEKRKFDIDTLTLME